MSKALINKYQTLKLTLIDWETGALALSAPEVREMTAEMEKTRQTLQPKCSHAHCYTFSARLVRNQSSTVEVVLSMKCRDCDLLIFGHDAVESQALTPDLPLLKAVEEYESRFREVSEEELEAVGIRRELVLVTKYSRIKNDEEATAD